MGSNTSLHFTVVTLASWLTDGLGLCSSSVMVIDVVAIATLWVWSYEGIKAKLQMPNLTQDPSLPVSTE